MTMVLIAFSGFALSSPLGKFYLAFGTCLLALCKPTVASSRLAYFLQHNPEEQLANAHVLLTPSCRHDISVYLRHLQEGSKWALQMFDSSGKPESGLLKGGHTFPGFYSECIEALPKGALPATERHLHVNPSFTSTYCLSSVRVAPNELKYKEGLIGPLCKDLADEDVSFATCVPSSCSEEDVSDLATLVLRELGCNGSAISSTCLTPRKPFIQDIPALATASFFLLLAVIVAAATTFDYAGMLRYKRYPHFASDSEQPNSITSTNDPQIIRASKNRAISVMLCFSLLQNVSKVFPKEKLKGASIKALNGLRFFSIIWVICSHSRYFGQATLLFRNSDDLTKSNVITIAIDRTTLAADTFLVIGGFLVAYLNLKNLRKANGKKNWLLFYVHRYFRTIPLMMAVVVMCAFLMRHFRDGPLWMEFIGRYESSCRANWWSIIIYLQNFLAENNQCIPQCWYSAVDFQLYLFSPPFLYILYRWPRVGASLCSICLVGAIVLEATVTALMSISSADGADFMKHVYMKPYFRMAPYLIGILLGHYTSDDIKRAVLKKRYQNIIWLLCVLCLLFGVFGLGAINPPAESAWFGLVHTVSEIAWCLGIGWIVYASMAGLDGFLIKFLSADIFGPLSKLVFAVYIVHQPILMVFYASRQETFDYDYYLMGYFFAGGVLLSFAVSTILCLFLEMPVYGLERLIFPRE